MVNCECGFNQSETGKYFESTISRIMISISFATIVLFPMIKKGQDGSDLCSRSIDRS